MNHLTIQSYLPIILGSVGSPGVSESKESTCKARDLGLILGQEKPLEKKVATHSTILAWIIPRTEEPGRLQSMGSQSMDMTN